MLSGQKRVSEANLILVSRRHLRRDLNSHLDATMRMMSPTTTCLYPAASLLLRNLSAVSQSLASNTSIASVAFGLLAQPPTQTGWAQRLGDKIMTRKLRTYFHRRSQYFGTSGGTDSRPRSQDGLIRMITFRSSHVPRIGV